MVDTFSPQPPCLSSGKGVSKDGVRGNTLQIASSPSPSGGALCIRGNENSGRGFTWVSKKAVELS